MKRLGIVGGIAPESTVEYYRLITSAYRERRGDGSYPEVIINSIDLKKMLDLANAGEWSEVADYLVREVQRLERAGANFGLLASNTPHKVFDEVRACSGIPLISIVEATRAEALSRGLKRVGLFGTRFTMRAGFYADTFAREGMTVVLPDEEEQDYIHEKYMSELIEGRFLTETRERLLAIAADLKRREAIEGLILGGTELPLILRDSSTVGIPFLDTTRIHVAAALAELLA